MERSSQPAGRHPWSEPQEGDVDRGFPGGRQVTNIDTALNIGWALLCVGALLIHWRWQRNRRAFSRRIQFYRALPVFLATVSLFPCISASDDHILLSGLDDTASGKAMIAVTHADHYQLIAQLQGVEHGRVTAPFVFRPSHCPVLLQQIHQPVVAHVFHRETSSRAPPTFV